MRDSSVMNRDSAESLALRVLAHLAARERLLSSFLAASGLSPADLSGRAADPELLAGVLDYLLANEPELVAFCADCGLDPTLPARAREHLPGGRAAGGGQW